MQSSRPLRTHSTTTDDERFLAEVSTTEVSTTGVSTTEMSTVGVSPDTYSDEYYYQSSESKDGFCPNADWTCTPLNIARTCGSFDSEGGSCSGLNAYPNATISDYGSISGNSAMQNEIYHCGPVACGIDAMPLLNWESGIISTAGSGTAHVISIVGSRPTRPKFNPLAHSRCKQSFPTTCEETHECQVPELQNKSAVFSLLGVVSSLIRV